METRIKNALIFLGNYDIYALILTTIILIVGGLLGLFSDKWLVSTVLFALTIFSVAMLKSRVLLENIEQNLKQTNSTFFLNKFPEEFNNNLDSAKEIWIVGVTLERATQGNLHKYEQAIQKGYPVKVLAVHPDSPAMDIAASRYYAPATRDPKQQGAKTITHLSLFYELKKTAVDPDKVQIRTISNPLSFGAICVNPNSPTGTLYLEHFPFQTFPDAIPKFVLHATDRYWYDFFKKELSILWESGNEWKPANQIE